MTPEQAQAEVGLYTQERWKYVKLARLVAGYLKFRVDSFAKEGKRVQWTVLSDIEHRAKDRQSVLKKLIEDKPDKTGLTKYTNYEDLGDLAGARVIFFYKDDLEEFALRKDSFGQWFGVESGEKLHRKLDPFSDEFGYDSFHLPVLVSEESGFYKALNPQP